MVIRCPPLLAGSVLHCGCGVVTGRCLLVHFGSSPTAYRHDKPPPQDELLLRGSRPRAAVDWQPVKSEHICDERWQLTYYIFSLRKQTCVHGYVLLHKKALISIKCYPTFINH